MKKLMMIFFVFLIFLVACANKEKQKYSKSFYETFDTQIQYLEYSESEEKFKENYKFVQDEFARLHKLYDNYRHYDGINNVMTINDNAGKSPVKVDEDLFNLIKFSIENNEKTLGKVNIAMGRVLEVWHDIREKNEGISDNETILPSNEELEEANKHVDINAIILDENEKSVYISDPEVRIDLGATAKGYATELVSKKLEEKGIDSASINAGGNVRTIGNKPDGKDWGIALQNPDLSSNEYLDVVFIKGSKSVVTSGDYQRFFMHKGKRYHHLIDPVSLQPLSLFRSVSIITEDSGLADLLSTAIYLSTEEEALEIIKNYEDEIGIVWATDEQKWNTKNLDDFLDSKRK